MLPVILAAVTRCINAFILIILFKISHSKEQQIQHVFLFFHTNVNLMFSSMTFPSRNKSYQRINTSANIKEFVNMELIIRRTNGQIYKINSFLIAIFEISSKITIYLFFKYLIFFFGCVYSRELTQGINKFEIELKFMRKKCGIN